jgi:hypothetical protein
VQEKKYMPSWILMKVQEKLRCINISVDHKCCFLPEYLILTSSTCSFIWRANEISWPDQCIAV